jgi:hypothetical protein
MSRMTSQQFDVALRAAQLMKTGGGSFAHNIGAAFLYADAYNQQRLHDAFPDLFEKYAAEAAAIRSAPTTA